MTPAPVPRTDPGNHLPRLDRHRPKQGPVARSPMGRRRAIVLLLVHVVIAAHIVHWLVAGTTLTPLEPSEAMQTLELGYLNAGAILFLLAIGSTLLLGRWFCGWACHVVALQDLCAWLLGRLGLRPRPIRSRLLVLIPFGAAFYMFVWPTLRRWWRGEPAPDLVPHLTTSELWATFPGPIMAVATLLVCGFLVVWWLGAKGFCTYGCPYGAVFAVADRLAPARIRVTDACEHCGHCTTVCSSNVRVHEEVAMHRMVVDPACMKCLDCVSVCPKDALYFGFGPTRPLQRSQQRIEARADFGWGEEIALAVLFVLGLWLWRDLWLGEPVPFLLAIGLSVLTAALLLLGWRLWRKPAVTFQHAELKRDGRLLGRGRTAAVLAVAGLATVAWLGIAEATRQRVETATHALAATERGSEGLRERLLAAEAATRTALWWSPGRDPRLLQVHGLLLRDLQRHPDAESALREAVARVADPGFLPRAANALAIYHGQRQEHQEAERLCRAVLERHPQDPTARAILERLGR